MDSGKYRYFCITVEEGSVSKAASVLGITQPSLSQTLAKIESELGAKLLERSVHGVTVTPAGKVVHKYAQDILAKEAEMLNEIQAQASEMGGTVRILATDAFASIVQVYSDFKSSHPQIDIRFINSGMVDDTEKMPQSFCDLIVTSNASLGKGMNPQKLFEDRFAAMVSKNHWAAELGEIDLGRLAGEMFLGASRKEYKQFQESLCLLAGYTPTIVLDDLSQEMIADLVRVNVGITIVPESLKGYYSDIASFVTITNPVFNRVVNLYWKTDEKNKAIEALKTRIIEGFT